MTRKQDEAAEQKREDAAERRAEDKASAKAVKAGDLFLVVRTWIMPGGSSQEQVRTSICGVFADQVLADAAAKGCLDAAESDEHNYAVFQLPVGVVVRDAVQVAFFTRK